MTNLERVTDLYNMIMGGKMMEGFEKYYAEDVVMTEMGEEPKQGKSFHREREMQWMQSIEAFNGGGVDAITSNEETGHTMVENWMDMSFKGGHQVKMAQVAVQEWKDGLISEERFYHK